jgi:hypothetical protein
VSTDGRVFRRFLAQDLAAGTSVRIDVPRVVGAQREQVYIGVGITLLAAMAMALIFAARRGTARRPAALAIPESPSRSLVRAIAALDAEFEHRTNVDEATRASYEARRAALKAQLASALAAERPPA